MDLFTYNRMDRLVQKNIAGHGYLLGFQYTIDTTVGVIARQNSSACILGTLWEGVAEHEFQAIDERYHHLERIVVDIMVLPKFPAIDDPFLARAWAYVEPVPSI